ncbi:MAG: patatin-like phospholipase family protein [Verrucomicrobiae bacterium]|nr:patatin-like phospholipase family protein [Verrucomicrobiae bacterium]
MEPNPAPPPRRRRILTLDGGGIRGVFSVELLVRMEELLRRHTGNPRLVLADHFDLIAGTSTGAIIASYLSWGESASEVRKLYLREAGKIFVRAPFWRLGRGWFDERRLTRSLQEFFVEDDAARSPALLGTRRLRTLLLLVMRNATTGSAWPITNHPAARFNQRLHADGQPNRECNLDLPLWCLVRASAAAPFYFPPESIRLGDQRFDFIDGGITAYNNPALIAFLTATLSSYRIDWPVGTDRLHLVSVGTGQTRARINELLRKIVSFVSYAAVVPAGLMDSISREQDLMCRTLGQCLFGAPIDSEIGDLTDTDGAGKQFTYVRYNREFAPGEVVEIQRRFRGGLALDNLRLVDFLCEEGVRYAGNLRLEHLL